MGWYDDAFRGNTASASTRRQMAAASGGNAAKALGDAFKDIGRLATEAKAQDRQNKLIDLETQQKKQQMQDQDLTAKAMQFDSKDAFGKWRAEQQEQDRRQYQARQKEYDNRLVSKLWTDEPEKPENKAPSAQAQERIDAHFQRKFNDEAMKEAVQYKSFEQFEKNNPDLIQNADGSTVQTIKTAFDSKDSEIAAMKAQEKEIKHERQVNDLKARLNKAEIKKMQESKENQGFRYTENTGTKIKNLVSTALGMDKDSLNLDDNKKREYATMVTEISQLSKDLGLEPNLAYKAWRKIETEKTKKPKSPKPTWKDFQ